MQLSLRKNTLSHLREIFPCRLILPILQYHTQNKERTESLIMLKELLKVAEAKDFFKVLKHRNNVTYNLNKCGLCMKENIINEWLRCLLSKTGKSFKVLVKEENHPSKSFNLNTVKELKSSLPIGLVQIERKKCSLKASDENSVYFAPSQATELRFSVLVQHNEAIQFFLQWQRYRKIWWSSISTSPGLFNLSDITYKEKSAEVDVMAKFAWGLQPVEKISMKGSIPLEETQTGDCEPATFVSSLNVESALLTLLADGYGNRTREGYIRLHRTIAPYKISYAIECQDDLMREKLIELVQLVNYRLNASGVTTWFPKRFHSDVEQQFSESYSLGVPYTVVVTPETLDTGIFQLLNSSTTLKEQIHISDFNEYALKLFKSVFI